jgi:hypothetical protein
MNNELDQRSCHILNIYFISRGIINQDRTLERIKVVWIKWKKRQEERKRVKCISVIRKIQKKLKKVSTRWIYGTYMGDKNINLITKLKTR